MAARFRTVCSVSAAAALAVTVLTAQEGRSGPGSRILIRAVANGQAVTDLTAADVALRINGKPHEIESLQLVSAADAPGPKGSPAAAGAKPALLPPPYESNRMAEAPAGPPGAREFLIIVDEDGIAPGQEEPVRKAVEKLMAESSPADRFGYLSLRIGGLNVPPGPSRAAVSAAVAKLVGVGSTAENNVDLVCRTKRSMGTLMSTFESAPAGRTLVLITSGLAANPAAVESIRSRVGAGGDFDNTIPETCQIRSNDLESFGVSASTSPANLYVVHFPQGLAAQSLASPAQTGTENLAGVSNAELIRLLGGNEASLGRIVQETSSYYIATLGTPVSETIRRIDVRANRDGIRVVARPATGAGESREMSSAARPRGSGKVTPRDMIRVATTFRDLPLRAAAFVSRQGTNDIKVMTLFEAEEGATKLTAASIVFYDEKGNAKAQWNAQGGDLQRSPVLGATVVPAGTYRLRVAATDAQGRGGTTDITLAAQLADAAPVKLGTMILGTDPKSPRLEFTSADKAVIGFLSIYGAPKDMNVAVTYEIREHETAQPLGTTPGNPIEVPGAPADERMFWGGFGLEPLAPGDYLMRAVVSVNGKEAGAASRTLRKVK